MRRYVKRFLEDLKKSDMVLLILLIVATAFGCLMIASTTNATSSGATRYLIIQIGASLAGIFLYFVISSIDTQALAEHRTFLVLFNTGLLLLLLTPFGVTVSGNRSWLDFPILPFNIQPAEICKISYVLITASIMTANQNRLSGPRSIIQLCIHLGLVAGLNWLISGDAGVSLIFAGIFVGMALSGGVHFLWFGIFSLSTPGYPPKYRQKEANPVGSVRG